MPTSDKEDLIRMMRQGTWVIVSPVDGDDRPSKYYLKDKHDLGYKERLNKRTVDALLKQGRLKSVRNRKWNIISLSDEEAALGYIIGTCGHTVKAKLRPIEVKATDSHGNHIIKRVLYCGQCHFAAMVDHRVLLTQSQKDAWLSSEE